MAYIRSYDRVISGHSPTFWKGGGHWRATFNQGRRNWNFPLFQFGLLYLRIGLEKTLNSGKEQGLFKLQNAIATLGDW